MPIGLLGSFLLSRFSVLALNSFGIASNYAVLIVVSNYSA